MKPFEAVAFVLTLLNCVPRVLIYPLEVDARVFRISALYQTVYEVLFNIFHTVGLRDITSDFTLDNAIFQNNCNNMKDLSFDATNVFEEIMKAFSYCMQSLNL